MDPLRACGAVAVAVGAVRFVWRVAVPRALGWLRALTRWSSQDLLHGLARVRSWAGLSACVYPGGPHVRVCLALLHRVVVVVPRAVLHGRVEAVGAACVCRVVLPFSVVPADLRGARPVRVVLGPVGARCCSGPVVPAAAIPLALVPFQLLWALHVAACVVVGLL